MFMLPALYPIFGILNNLCSHCQDILVAKKQSRKKTWIKTYKEAVFGLHDVMQMRRGIMTSNVIYLRFNMIKP